MSAVAQLKRNAATVEKTKPVARNDVAERKALVRSLRGSLSWVDYSVDQFIAEKRAEVEQENRS